MIDNNYTQLTARGLQRRIKRQLLKGSHGFLATTNPGFEHILLSEIEQLDGVEDIKVISGGVEFCGPLDLIYSTNLYLRTANRVLMRIGSFTVRSYPELFNKCKRTAWELYNGFSEKVHISVSSRSSRLHHTDNIKNSVFDAIHEHMEKLGVKVSLDVDAEIVFYVRFFQDTCTVSIDCSGELLYKRGYRIKIASAPLRETIASAVLREVQLDRFGVIMDPLCGSGVFMLEAASLLLHKAPGINRRFAFSKWPSFDNSKWIKFLEKARQNEVNNITTILLASDISNNALDSASENASLLGVQDIIKFSMQDCLTIKPVNGPGLIVSNLPYGKRIEFDRVELHEFFKLFGKNLKEKFIGWKYAFITAEPDFEKVADIPVEKTINFSNGGIPVKLVIGRLG